MKVIDKILINTIKQTLSELKQIETTQLSDADKSEIIEDVDEVIQMALSIKLKSQKDELNHFIQQLDAKENKLDAPTLKHITNHLNTLLKNINELQTNFNLAA